MTPLAIGTDGGGSVRIPASFCGVVGLKPTFGLVPKMPGFHGWHTLSVDGPMARTVRDTALLLSVVAGPHPADDRSYPSPQRDYVEAVVEERDLSRLRVAWSVDLGIAPIERDVRAAFLRAVETFGQMGFELVETHPPTRNPVSLWNTIATIEGYASEGPVLERSPSLVGADAAELIRAGEGRSAREYVEAQYARAAYTRSWLEFFEDFDLLLTPMMQMTAFPLGITGPKEVDGRSTRSSTTGAISVTRRT
jgi:Asp-tRNA(Asn)/Glu-tRNA(Gln) amidotransferase A subunit family amidase